MGMVEAGPAPRMRSPAITTIELVKGGPPEPSISTAPMIALLWLSSGALQAEVTSRRQRQDREFSHGASIIPERAGGLRSTIYPDMTPEIVPDAEPQPKGLGEGSRLTGVFFEPAKTFEDVAARPNFWAPLILVIVVSLVYMVLFGQHVGWERMIRHQTEMSSRAAQLIAGTAGDADPDGGEVRAHRHVCGHPGGRSRW